MSPIDDELRAALHGRAAVLTPSPDPLSGIERRAKRLRRNRASSAIGASVLAVAAIALAVPVLTTPSAAPPPTGPAATQQPPALAARPSNALAWGGAPLSSNGLDRAVVAAWSDDHAADPGEVLGERLFSTQLPDTRATAAIYQLWVEGGPAFSVVTQGDASISMVLRDTESTPDVPYVDDVVSGPHVVVAVAPTVTALDYAGDGKTYRPVALSGGGGLTLRTMGAGWVSDRLRITDRQAGLVEADVYAGPTDGDPGVGDGESPNLLGNWTFRGDRAAGPADRAVLKAFSAAVQSIEPAGEARFLPLFAGSTDSGLSYVFGQAWIGSRPAYTVGLITGGTQGDQFFLGPVTPDAPPVLAFVLCCSPGSTVDTLVVVPQPGTGQVRYDDDDTGAFRPVGAGQDSLDGVVLIDRDPRAQSDRLQLLDGNGDRNRPIFTGSVFTLLCGLKGCG